MVTLKLYSLSKEENSTKQPTGGITATGVLIEPCSVLNPVIKLNNIIAYSYNYAYVQEFGRYYFINDWVSEDGFWYVKMNVDVMATFKSAIGSSTQYILRAAGAQDEYILDTMYPSTGKVSHSQVQINSALMDYLPDGVFVINVMGSSDNGTIGSYACYWSTFKNVISEMYLMNDDDTWWSNLADGIRNSIFQPFDHIANVIWFPADYMDTSGITSVSSITLGTIVLSSTPGKPMTFYPISTPSVWNSSSKSLPKHPQASSYGKYMNLKPFTQYIYSDDIFGNIELDPLKLVDKSTFTIWKVTDPLTGLQIVALPDEQTRVGQCGVLISMENNSLNIGGLLSSIATAGVSLATANPVGAIAGLMSATDAAIPVTSSTSQQGSTIQVHRSVALDAFFWNATGHDDAHKGKPYCKTKQINTLSGYILTENAHVETPNMTVAEQEMITSIMNSGFYYE